MNILLISPKVPSTFWSFHNALKFISKKSSEPPLGLLTVAAMLPKDWELKLIDMNVTQLKDKNIQWADYVFISGMNVHKKSFTEVVKRCNELRVKVVAGGPLVTTEHEDIEGVDHFILNEAEITLPQFLQDLKKGTPKYLYSTDEYPDISSTPIPRWDLLDMKKYGNMCLQYSRGCPYNCEFCSITMLNGRKPRTKSREQVLGELDALYQFGWRGPVFIVDDNFIGNKRKLKSETLPAMVEWAQEHNYPFHYITEASINLADDDQLIKLMVSAGFDAAFIGIETINDDSLVECGKTQNQKRDLLTSVKKLQRHGLNVSAGFIVGFDQDPPNIFEKQIDFIQKSGIVTAMVGLLNAPAGTRLFKRLKSENRLQLEFSGDNMDGSTNIIPKMEYNKLIQGYRSIVQTIYSPKEYYERVKTFLKEYHVPSFRSSTLTFQEFLAFWRSVWVLGMREKGKRYYWKLLLYSLWNYPRKFHTAVTLAIYGFHFRRVVETI